MQAPQQTSRWAGGKKPRIAKLGCTESVKLTIRSRGGNKAGGIGLRVYGCRNRREKA